MVPQYKHITLTGEEKKAVLKRLTLCTDKEKAEALRLARKVKDAINCSRDYVHAIAKEKVYPMFTAQQLKDTILSNGYHVTGHNLPILDQLCFYFTDDPKFMGSLNKGIYLIGPVGCGKTYLMNLFRANQKQSYGIKACREISYEFGQYGFDILLKYGKINHLSENGFGHTTYGLCLDDLGTDDYRKFFGNKVNPLQEIIQQRYDHGLFKETHITTNISDKQAIDIYGARVNSRRKEMFNVIPFNLEAPDMRT